MRDDGHWWYDQRSPQGDPTNPATNTDVISPAFWSVTGTEFKITRSDDPTQTALLVTTGGCLGGQTFRSKLTSYGNFRNSVVWASDKCLGSCSVQYGRRYQSTHGLQQAACDGGLQSRCNRFWCNWDVGDGSVQNVHVLITGLGSLRLNLLLLKKRVYPAKLNTIVVMKPTPPEVPHCPILSTFGFDEQSFR